MTTMEEVLSLIDKLDRVELIKVCAEVSKIRGELKEQMMSKEDILQDLRQTIGLCKVLWRSVASNDLHQDTIDGSTMEGGEYDIVELITNRLLSLYEMLNKALPDYPHFNSLDEVKDYTDRVVSDFQTTYPNGMELTDRS